MHVATSEHFLLLNLISCKQANNVFFEMTPLSKCFVFFSNIFFCLVFLFKATMCRAPTTFGALVVMPLIFGAPHVGLLYIKKNICSKMHFKN